MAFFASLAAEARADRAASAPYSAVEAVVVGVGHYRHSAHWPKLANAEHDAQNFARLMRSLGAGVTVRRSTQATRRQIINSLDDAAAALKRRGGDRATLLVFYFAGHGVTRTSDGGGGYLIPFDGEPNRTPDWLSMATLKQKADEYRHVRHVLFMLGSCFSGSLMRSHSVLRPNQELRSRHMADGWIAQNLKRDARLAITAGRADQRIPDGAAGRGSEFGNAVVNAFERPEGSRFAAADLNKDHCVSTDEWFAHVSVNGRTRFNLPFFVRLPGDNQGSVVLCRKPQEKPESTATSEPTARVATPVPPERPLNVLTQEQHKETERKKRTRIAWLVSGITTTVLAVGGVSLGTAYYVKSQDLDDTTQEWADAANVAMWSYIVAGALTVGAGLSWYFYATSGKPPSPSARGPVSPVVTAGAAPLPGGAVVSGIVRF